MVLKSVLGCADSGRLNLAGSIPLAWGRQAVVSAVRSAFFAERSTSETLRALATDWIDGSYGNPRGSLFRYLSSLTPSNLHSNP